MGYNKSHGKLFFWINFDKMVNVQVQIYGDF